MVCAGVADVSSFVRSDSWNLSVLSSFFDLGPVLSNGPSFFLWTISVKFKNPNGWTLEQGLAAQYAAQAGIDPDLGAQAGEAAWDPLKALRDAVDEHNPQRKDKLIQRAFQHLKRADLGRHRDLVDQILTALRSLSPKRTSPTVNPKTNLQEFSVECADEGGCRQDYIVTDPINTMNHTFVYDANGNYNPNQSHVSVLDPSRYGGPTPNQHGPSGLSPRSRPSQPSILGQVIPPDEEPATGVVPMPTEAYFINLRDGVNSVIRHPEFMSDEVLLWARREILANWDQAIYTQGIPMTYGEGVLNGLQSGLGSGPGMMWDHIESDLAHQLSPIVQEINRRVGEGTWSLEAER